MTDPQHRMAAAIAENVKAVIRYADANTPRSLQSAIGPSEYGHPCQRRIAYKVLGWPEANPTVDPWKRNVGTAAHTYLERVFGSLDETLPDGRPRYLVEQKLNIVPGLSGHSDLFDRALRVSIDWKVPGPTTLKETKRRGVVPEDSYVIQAHSYGLGWTNAGETVDYVAVVMLPRNGDLKDVLVWAEPYDPTVVDRALARWQQIISAVSTLDVENHPERFTLIAAEPSRLCGWCSYFKALSTDPSQGCPGNTADLTANGVLMRGAA